MDWIPTANGDTNSAEYHRNKISTVNAYSYQSEYTMEWIPINRSMIASVNQRVSRWAIEGMNSRTDDAPLQVFTISPHRPVFPFLSILAALPDLPFYRSRSDNGFSPPADPLIG